MASHSDDINSSNDHEVRLGPPTKRKKNCKEKLIISWDSGWKSYFDIAILLLVGYSCFSTLLYVAYGTPTNELHKAFDDFVEYMFYTDFLFNFLQEYRDPDTLEPVRDLKRIAVNYFKGWFFVDFVSIFPFEHFLNSGVLTKLVRLFRLPRLVKLLDISRFNKLLKSFQNKNSDDQTIVK